MSRAVTFTHSSPTDTQCSLSYCHERISNAPSRHFLPAQDHHTFSSIIFLPSSIMPGKQLSDVEKSRILTLVEEKVSLRKIASRTGRHFATIKRLNAAARSAPDCEIPLRKHGSGRPRKTSADTDELLRKEVLKNPKITAGQLKKMHPQLLRDVSQRTIQHRLTKQLKMPTRVPAKKPLLTPAMMKKRLAFARQYEAWTEDDWKKVMWSDESTFRCFTERQGRVRRPVGASRYEEQYLKKTVRHPPSLMVWGCYSGERGWGALHILPHNVTMNSNIYIEVLRNHMLPSFNKHKCTVFMHDSAPPHRAKKVFDFLRESNVQVLDWPSNSPDLNPIENCWSNMKRKMENYDTSSLPRLEEALHEMWTHDLDWSYFKKLSSSMPRRLQEVIKAKGGVIKY